MEKAELLAILLNQEIILRPCTSFWVLLLSVTMKLPGVIQPTLQKDWAIQRHIVNNKRNSTHENHTKISLFLALMLNVPVWGQHLNSATNFDSELGTWPSTPASHFYGLSLILTMMGQRCHHCRYRSDWLQKTQPFSLKHHLFCIDAGKILAPGGQPVLKPGPLLILNYCKWYFYIWSWPLMATISQTFLFLWCRWIPSIWA